MKNLFLSVNVYPLGVDVDIRTVEDKPGMYLVSLNGFADNSQLTPFNMQQEVLHLHRAFDVFAHLLSIHTNTISDRADVTLDGQGAIREQSALIQAMRGNDLSTIIEKHLTLELPPSTLITLSGSRSQGLYQLRYSRAGTTSLYVSRPYNTLKGVLAELRSFCIAEALGM